MASGWAGRQYADSRRRSARARRHIPSCGAFAPPKQGHGFTGDDDRSEAPRTALLSDAFFRSRFGGDPSTIGKTIVLNRLPYTVIGVAPDGP